jgi:heavy metal sensor kinase
LTAATPETIEGKIEEIYSPEKSNRFIRISQDNGKTVYVSGPPDDRTFDPATIPFIQNYSDHISERIEPVGTKGHLLIAGLVAPSGGSHYTIEMGAPTDQIDSALHKLIVTLLIGLPAVVVIAVVGGSVLVRRALHPVEILRGNAEKITFSNLSQRLPVDATGDALEHLAQTLNQMLERLDLAYQQASRFSADASHELRTPLTIMRGELESIEAEMRAQQLPMAFRERIGSVLEEAERLSTIVEGLFAIARLDAGEAKIEDVPCDLAALARSTTEQMQLLADDKRLAVTVVAAPEPVFVMGDAARLKQIIVNLLDNAIKYTLAGGALSIAVRAESNKAILHVQDNGIGIPAEALPHLFERFYRADKVRSRGTQGAGLGLSIIRAICQAHGGTIRIQSVEGAGTAVTVELPLAPENSSPIAERT